MPARWCASTSTRSWCSTAISKRAPRSRIDRDRRAGIRDPARSGAAGGDQAGASLRASSTPVATACAASCSARADRRCSPCARCSTAPAPGQPQGWIAFARAFTPTVVERMGRFSPWPVTGFPVANLDRAGVPDEVRDWVRHSPLTANLLTRVAGRRHVNGYLILRDQVGTPIWLVQLEIPRSAYRAGDAHHALPDDPARPAGRRLHASSPCCWWRARAGSTPTACRSSRVTAPSSSRRRTACWSPTRAPARSSTPIPPCSSSSASRSTSCAAARCCRCCAARTIRRIRSSRRWRASSRAAASSSCNGSRTAGRWTSK